MNYKQLHHLLSAHLLKWGMTGAEFAKAKDINPKHLKAFLFTGEYDWRTPEYVKLCLAVGVVPNIGFEDVTEKE